LHFWPVLDGDVVPAANAQLYGAGQFNDTPVLIGFNSDEGSGDVPPNATAKMFAEQAKALPCPDEGVAILNTYPHDTDAAAVRAFKDISRDAGYGWNAWKWAQLQAQAGRHKVFVYYFDVRTNEMPEGARHGAEVPYVFGNFDSNPRSEDLAVSALMRKYWINFAATGDPNEAGLPPWPPFSNASPQAMVFDQNSSGRPLPNLDHMKALDAWFSCLREAAAK
jgi:para-nitrobenzyl esterase